MATVSGYRRRGTPTAPRTQVAVIERHVRAPWSLPLFAAATTLGVVLVVAIPPSEGAQAVVSAPQSPGNIQTIVVAGDRDAVERGEYDVIDPPKSTAPASGVPDPGTAQAIAFEMVMARGWDVNEYDCLVALWTRESHWNVYAHNPSSGAYGIPQSLPGDKMASAGADWKTNPKTQITWGLGYIGGRYGTPCGAWAHSESVGWY